MGCGSSEGQASIAVAVALRGREGGATAELGDEVQNCLRASNGGGDKPHVLIAMQVRRLTPRECERLQGFPDDYTRIPSWSGWRKMGDDETPEQLAAEGLEVKQNKKTGRWRVKDVDGPRYKALGNSWAVPNVRWIGERLQQVEAIRQQVREAA
jgi:DNA (cytosine-5)-methyltransferase 1